MMHKNLAIFISFLVITSGCTINKVGGYQSPEFISKNINSVYVVHQPKDKRNLHLLIKSELESKGYKVSTGNEVNIPEHIEGKVTYIDKWMWDMSNYLMELTVFLRDPGSGYPMASGHSLHGSLTRLSPSEMVEEVVGNMLGQTKSGVRK